MKMVGTGDTFPSTPGVKRVLEASLHTFMRIMKNTWAVIASSGLKMETWPWPVALG
jgi:hypothetical protein